MKAPDRPLLGRIHQGPEFHGCCNSGARTGILRSRLFKDYPKLAGGYRYAVGPAMWLTDAAKAKTGLFGLKAKPKGRTWTSSSNAKVYFYKTAAVAKRKFVELCAEVEGFNASAIASAAKARAKLKADPLDVGAVLALGDIGEI